MHEIPRSTNECCLPSPRPWAAAARTAGACAARRQLHPPHTGAVHTCIISNLTRPVASPSAIARNDVSVGWPTIDASVSRCWCVSQSLRVRVSRYEVGGRRGTNHLVRSACPDTVSASVDVAARLVRTCAGVARVDWWVGQSCFPAFDITHVRCSSCVFAVYRSSDDYSAHLAPLQSTNRHATHHDDGRGQART
jgi:hypothetical protein